MSLLKNQVVSCGLSIMFIGHQTFLGILRVETYFGSFDKDVRINWDVVSAYDDTLRGWMIVKSVKLVGSNLNQSQSFVVCCQQPFKDVFGKW